MFHALDFKAGYPDIILSLIIKDGNGLANTNVKIIIEFKIWLSTDLIQININMIFRIHIKISIL